MDGCGVVVDRCGVVVARCGSLWLVPGFSNYGWEACIMTLTFIT